MFESLNKPKTYLLLGNILLAFFLILLNNLKIIPLHSGDFLFFAFLTLAFAMYRPGWCFLLFIGMISLENINLAPVELGINIRPYQFIGAIIILALIIRLLTKRLSFKLLKPLWYDWLVLILVFGGFLGIRNAPDKIASFKLAIIIGTFAALYYLVRNYIQNTEDLKKIIPFFLNSSIIVVLYGIWQNWRFLHNLSNFEAMPGRPNGTFGEADWLGIFLVLLISVIYILIYKSSNDKFQIPNQIQNPNSKLLIMVYALLTVIFVLLILTVSRSAWLGALVVTFIFLFTIWTNLRFKNWQWMETVKIKSKILASFIVAIAIVYIFHLTNFQLFNRVQSLGTGMQKITVSCNVMDCDCTENGQALIKSGQIINDISELEKYECKFINLEDIEKEKSQGKFVTEIFRNDPNVKTRSEIYQKSWNEIKNHPVLGIGWGSVGNILGKDGRGVPLNSSNIFLETWLGSGILGFLALVILFIYILLKSVKNYYYASGNLQKIINLFIIVSWFAVFVPNMFNAGIFLGIFWVWIAVAQVKSYDNWD